MPCSSLRPAIFATLMLAAPAAHAGERLPPAPWTTLGPTRTSVGSCATDEFSEIRTCYLVRCEPQAGLVFAIQDPNLGVDGVRRVRLTVGRQQREIALHGATPGERWVNLRDAPALFAMLTSGASWANLQTVRARTDYGTGFDLTGAKRRIVDLRARCRG